jgi:hypothetical protein
MWSILGLLRICTISGESTIARLRFAHHQRAEPEQPPVTIDDRSWRLIGVAALLGLGLAVLVFHGPWQIALVYLLAGVTLGVWVLRRG